MRLPPTGKQLMQVLRGEFNSNCLHRDGFRCVVCRRMAVHMSVHHIIDRHLLPNDGYTVLNGITLCDDPQRDGSMSCHLKAEQYHVSKGRKPWPGFHPLDLLRRINSGVREAWLASAALADHDGPRMLVMVTESGAEEYYLDGVRLEGDEAVLEAVEATGGIWPEV